MFELELFELSKIESLRLIHLFICIIGSLFLIFTWKRITSVNPENKKDIGALLLAGAFIMWAFMDAYRFTGFMKPGESSLVIKTFSAYNNAFFLASLPYFKESFSWAKKNIRIFNNKTQWALVVLASNIILVMLYSFTWKNETDSGLLVSSIDLAYSILTYLFLGYAIIKELHSNEELRNSILFIIGILLSISLIIIQLTFSPLFKIINTDIISAAALISHTTLAILLISLRYERLLIVRSLIISEENRTEEKIRAYTLKNHELQTELNQLRTQIQNERSLSALSERELEVLGHIENSYSEIAERLFISRDTVISHKKNIESKLGINGKKGLEEFARSKGLISK